MRTSLFVIFSLCAALSAQAPSFRAAGVFGDHMVMPAGTVAPMHGFGPSGAEVVAKPSWGAPVKARVDDRGRWSLQLPTPARGERGAVELVCGDASQQLRDVLFGDVWLASGQSNMEWRLSQCDGAAEAAAGADLPELRVFTTQNATADVPAEDVEGQWVVCTPETAPSFTAVGFYFARELLAEGKGPIGIVDSTWGGTVCQAWTSAAGLADFPEFADQLEKQRRGVSADELASRRAAFFEALRALDAPREMTKANLPERWSQVGLGSFDGAIDYVRTLELPAEFVGRDLDLCLGAIDDMDTVFWNGRRVAGSEREGVWNQPRRYRIPAAANNVAKVELRLCVVDTGGEGGFAGGPDGMRLELVGADRSYPLAGAWMRGKRAAMSDLPAWPRSNGGPNRPAVLWNAMVEPLLPFGFAGAIWYQGESNRGAPDQYARLFPAMIRDWRRAMQSELPFYFVQIAPYGYGGDGDNLTARLRDAQAAALQLPRTGMAVTLDCGDPRDIHPRNKVPVGERLARHALSQCYGEVLDCDGPVAREARRLGDSLRVTFEEQGRLELRGGGDGFWIAGEDGAFHAASAAVDGRTVVLRSDEVPAPVQVRYAWSAAPKCSLFDEHGLPAPPFSMRAR